LPVRVNLEGLAVELAVARLTSSELATLQWCIECMETALQQRDVQAYLADNSQFHLTLYQACGNPVLLRMIESLWLQVGPFFNRLFTEADLSLRLNDFHEEVFTAIQAGDAMAARAAIEQDLNYFGRFLLNLLSLE
jgi:DNA-binding GntR family transcriptional regulator